MSSAKVLSWFLIGTIGAIIVVPQLLMGSVFWFFVNANRNDPFDEIKRVLTNIVLVGGSILAIKTLTE